MGTILATLDLKRQRPTAEAAGRLFCWLREGAQISTCERMTDIRCVPPTFAIWHRKLRWLRGLTAISTYSFELPRRCQIHFLYAISAHCCRSLADRDAAVLPVEPDFRRRCMISLPSKSHIADKPTIRCCAKSATTVTSRAVPKSHCIQIHHTVYRHIGPTLQVVCHF